MVEATTETETLAGYTGRVAGTDAERRAAVYLRGRLADVGRDAETEPIFVSTRFGLAHATHAVIAIAGSVTSVGAAAPGAAVVLAAALLTFLDVLGWFTPVRRLYGRRASQNVVSYEGGDKPGVLVLAAAYDSPRESGGLRTITRVLRDPWLAMLLAMLVILACCALRVAGVDSIAVTAVQFVPTVLLILLTPPLVDIELSGAGSDPAGAAAAATVLRLADELQGSLSHFDLWVVFTGTNQPFALGMRAWIRANRMDLARETTAVVSVSAAGSGPVHYTRREGPLAPQRCHRDLLRIGAEVAEDAATDGDSVPFSFVSREPSNTSRALSRRLPAITVSTAGSEPADAAALDRLHGFTRELIERLDAEVGPALGSPA